MVTERELQETLARCVSTMVFYHNSGRSQQTSEQMAGEIQTIVRFIKELGLEDGEAEANVIEPLKVELINRYGHELGPRLFGGFAKAFDGVRAAGSLRWAE